MAAKLCAHCGQNFNAYKSARHCSLACALWSKVEKRGVDDCWPWKGAQSFYGYGSLSFEGARHRSNRAVLEVTVGGGGGLDALHLCHNPACCNPTHLKWGTHKENMEHKAAAGRENRPKGENHWNSRIDKNTASAIKAALAAGRRQTEIAITHGVKRSLVADISAGRAWKEI